jgi:hypothetical protein
VKEMDVDMDVSGTDRQRNTGEGVADNCRAAPKKRKTLGQAAPRKSKVTWGTATRLREGGHDGPASVSDAATAQPLEKEGGRKKGKFSEVEDILLKKAVESLGQKWSEANLLPGRAYDQILCHYLNHLDPSINKGDFSEEEDGLLKKAFESLGQQ